MAHSITSSRKRTRDVLTTQGGDGDDGDGEHQVDFESMMLSRPVLQGLHSMGFVRPSPIQLRAIPLGRLGVDIIAQSKSGTGKTCVFSVVALENLDMSSDEPSAREHASTARSAPPAPISRCKPQCLILAPTREIALQSNEVLRGIGKFVRALRVSCFIGGLSVAGDQLELQRGCHVAIGTPGRIAALVHEGALVVSSVRLLVLDEADKLLDATFEDQVRFVLASLPKKRQTLALSATYPPGSIEKLESMFMMKEPQRIIVSADTPSLEGVQQYFVQVDDRAQSFQELDAKVEALVQIFDQLSFNQCIVFCNDRARYVRGSHAHAHTHARTLAWSLMNHATCWRPSLRAHELAARLNEEGWSAAYIAGEQPQPERMEAMRKLRSFLIRVLVSTDLVRECLSRECAGRCAGSHERIRTNTHTRL